jgi:hypothetical protein
MNDGSLTAKPLRQTKQTNCTSVEGVLPAWGWAGGSFWPSLIGYKILKNKNLRAASRNAILYLTDIRSYFIIPLQSLLEVHAK